MKRSNLIYLVFAFVIALALVQCVKQEATNTNDAENYSNQVLKKDGYNLKEYLKSKGYNATEISNDFASGNFYSCYTPGSGCFKIDTTDTIFIQGYCDDSVKAVVDYTIYICPFEDPVLIIHQAYPIECDFKDVWGDITNDELDKVLRTFWYKASLVVEEKFVRGYMPSRFQCPNSSMSTSVFDIQCYQWCVITGGRPGEDVLMGFYKIYCGDKCCKRIRTFCWKRNGNLKISNPEFISLGGECDLPYEEPCKNGRLLGNCERQCGAP